MESLPPPPTRLPRPQPGEVVELVDADVVRIYASGGSYPLRWDQARESPDPVARLDPHGAGAVGVWYGSAELATALAEAFQETRTVFDRPDDPRVCIARLTAARLLNLASDWSTRAGCGSLLATARHEETQPWAAAIRAGFPDLDGVHWPSSVRPNGSAFVLWLAPGARPALEARPLLDRAIDDPAIALTIVAETRKIGFEYALPPPP